MKWIFTHWSADVSMKKGNLEENLKEPPAFEDSKDDWMSLPEVNFDP